MLRLKYDSVYPVLIHGDALVCLQVYMLHENEQKQMRVMPQIMFYCYIFCTYPAFQYLYLARLLNSFGLHCLS